MKLIEYEKRQDELDMRLHARTTAFHEENLQILLLDIAHSLSIMAETTSAQYEQSKGLISASQSVLENAEKELAKLSDEQEETPPPS